MARQRRIDKLSRGQAKNLQGALGTPTVAGGVFLVWLGGIGLGVLAFALFAGINIFGGAGMAPANLASADYNDKKQVSDQAQYTNIAREGEEIFNQKCGGCHIQGGQASGIGPRLDRSHNARDMSYINTIVRQGACGPNNVQCGMPYFKKADDGVYAYFISDADLYKVTVYLRSIQEAPRGQRAQNYVPPTVAPPGN
jgi:mono/diheme cytochrome c family protein